MIIKKNVVSGILVENLQEIFSYIFINYNSYNQHMKHCLLLAIFIIVLLNTTTSFQIHPDTQQTDFNAENCRFAKKYPNHELLTPSVTDQFLTEVVKWERNFIRQVGVQNSSGFTYDGYRLDVQTGQLLPGGLHFWTASSKQSIHVGLLSKVLEGDTYANMIYTVEEVLDIIQKKVNTFKDFYQRYPGFAGYLPWVFLNGTKPEPTWDFKSRVPSLDNGQLFWAAIALSSIWQQKYPTLKPELQQQWASVTWKAMIKNARRVFFNQTTRKIRAVSVISNISKDPSQNTYTNDDYYYLDDPYEGQLYAWIITLFCKDQFTQQQIDYIWEDKRNKLKSIQYKIHSLNNVSVTVEKGWWFSAHQQWKNLFMPYYLSKTYKKIKRNNEVARTWHSVDEVISGLYASVTGTAMSNQDDLDYYTDCGIQSISWNKVTHTHQVTPYGSYPVFLQNREVGATWLHNMIFSPAGQTIYGALQSTTIDGTSISPVLTWDTKITTVLSIMNGTTKIVENFLKKNNLLSQFVDRIQKQYSRQFTDIKGEELPLAIPRVTIKRGRPDFTTCR